MPSASKAVEEVHRASGHRVAERRASGHRVAGDRASGHRVTGHRALVHRASGAQGVRAQGVRAQGGRAQGVRAQGVRAQGVRAQGDTQTNSQNISRASVSVICMPSTKEVVADTYEPAAHIAQAVLAVLNRELQLLALSSFRQRLVDDLKEALSCPRSRHVTREYKI